MKERAPQAGSPCTRERIVQVAIRLHRGSDSKKTTVADIARGASMSPANVYRFFASKQAIEEAVVADLFEQVSAAATLAALLSGSALERLTAALTAISQLHEHRLENDSKLHELVAAAYARTGQSRCLTQTGSGGLFARSLLADRRAANCDREVRR